MADQSIIKRPADYSKKIGLVLQGGGALGSYQAGVYQSLAEADYLPDWVVGISIGAINAAIIAGNAPEKRLLQLERFWHEVTKPHVQLPLLPLSDSLARSSSAFGALMFGQSGFFVPRPWTDWLTPQVSFYDTSRLRSTLEALVDFDRINAKETRVSFGAANVRTGDFTYFDSIDTQIRPEHVMASGALPPGFPPVEIDGEYYWDGGLVSNTPLEYVIDYVPRRSRLTFQVDLFSPDGPVPTNLDMAVEREKDIRYSSRTRTATDMYRVLHNVRHNINDLIEKLPPDLRASKEAEFLYMFGCVTRMDIVRLGYRPAIPDGQSKDYEFSRATMERRWARGAEDAVRMLASSPWLAPMAQELGARVFDLDNGASHPPQTTLFNAAKVARPRQAGKART